MLSLGDSFAIWNVGIRRVVPKALLFRTRKDLDAYLIINHSLAAHKDRKSSIDTLIMSGRIIVMSDTDELTAVGPIRGCIGDDYRGVVSHPVHGESYLVIPGRF
jgi:hypothetical protein